MVYYSRRQCSNPDDCAQTPSPTVERVLHTMAGPSTSRIKKNIFFGPQEASYRSLWATSEPNDTRTAPWRSSLDLRDWWAFGAWRASASYETLAVTRRIDGVELDAIDAAP